jgi:two-component system response regulator FixJ
MTDGVVHVIDDDDAVRDSISFLLRTANIDAVTHVSAAEFLRAIPDLAGCCIVTDIRMPGMSGIELIREMRRRSINVPTVFITGHGDVPLAVEAMKLGAADFIEKPFDDAQLLGSIRAALEQTHDQERREAEAAEIRRRMDGLTERERQVLGGLVAGKPNKIIAYELDISPRTVEIYRANVMTKMQAGSLSELVRMALKADEGGPA